MGRASGCKTQGVGNESIWAVAARDRVLVPAGLMTAQSAGATPKDTATCTANTGTLHLSPGVRSTDKAGQ